MTRSFARFAFLLITAAQTLAQIASPVPPTPAKPSQSAQVNAAIQTIQAEGFELVRGTLIAQRIVSVVDRYVRAKDVKS